MRVSLCVRAGASRLVKQLSVVWTPQDEKAVSEKAATEAPAAGTVESPAAPAPAASEAAKADGEGVLTRTISASQQRATRTRACATCRAFRARDHRLL